MDTPTLIILGAGASAPYGLPLAGKLLKDALTALDHYAPAPDSMAGTDSVLHSIEANKRRKLADQIRRSGVQTVDAYFRHNKNASLLEEMVAAIWKAEDHAIASEIETPDAWLSELYHNKLYQQPDEFKKNQIAFASFNYDRLPLALLAKMMSNTFHISIRSAVEKINTPVTADLDRFFHCHGSINSALYPNMPSGTEVFSRYSGSFKSTSLAKAVHDIKIIYDEEHQKAMSPIFHKYLKWAKRVVVLGLGYHPEMLSLFPKIPDDMKFSFYDFTTRKWVGDTDTSWVKSKDFFGGTGYQLMEPQQRSVKDWGKSSFTLGDRDVNSSAFLAEHL